MAKQERPYFKHDLAAYRHPKMVALRLKGHAAAEPFYWAVLCYVHEHRHPLDTGSIDFVAFAHDMCCSTDDACEAIDQLAEVGLLYSTEDGLVSCEGADATVAEWDAKGAARAEAGAKGGRGKQTEANDKQTEAKGKQTEANGKQTETSAKQTEAKPKQTEAELRTKNLELRTENKELKGEGAREYAPKHPYGEYGNVKLSDGELAKLQAQFPDLQQRIERLDGYIEQTGKRYKSHYATIRNWARKDAEEAKGRASPARGGTIYEVGDDGEGWMPE